MANILSKKTFRDASIAVVISSVITTIGGSIVLLSKQGNVSYPVPVSATSSATKPDPLIGGLPFSARVRGSGSTLKTNGMDGKAGAKYAAACIDNPLEKIGYGSGGTVGGRNSGSIIELTWHNYKGQGMGGDISLVRSCLDDGTGSTVLTLINDTCVQTGCTQTFTLTGTGGAIDGRGVWSGDWKLKYGLRGNPGAGFDGLITGRIRDNFGE